MVALNRIDGQHEQSETLNARCIFTSEMAKYYRILHINALNINAYGVYYVLHHIFELRIYQFLTSLHLWRYHVMRILSIDSSMPKCTGMATFLWKLNSVHWAHTTLHSHFDRIQNSFDLIFYILNWTSICTCNWAHDMDLP